jgi:hypothetical protein
VRHRHLLLLLASSFLFVGCPAEPVAEDAGPEADAPAADVRGGDAGACTEDAACDDGLFCTGTERCESGRCVNEPVDCDDGVACTLDVCSEEGRRCESAPADDDGDGFHDAACLDDRGMPLGDDCDDADALRFPGNTEICDTEGHDEDCDPATLGGTDVDMDGYVSAACCLLEESGTRRCGDDCDDAVDTTHPMASEVCNGIDDDCDMRTDDIIEGTVICRTGQTRPCTTSCSLSGTQACNDSCLGWDTCVADEVCNGCDDDDDGADDDGFECMRGASSACTTSCGTSGTQLCTDTCGFGLCSASESCNYCDDDGDGNFHEERPLASLTSSTSLMGCGDLLGSGVSCDTAPWARGFDLWAELLDGTANDQAGAMWFDPSWTMGWGAIELDVELEVTAVTAGGGAEMPLGGWAVVLGRGTTGVGTPQAGGVPTTIEGIAARWYWSRFDSCDSSGRPPSNDDSVRGLELSSGGTSALVAREGASDSGCFSGDQLEGSATDFDGPGSGVVTQRIRLRYTPDDPTTAAVDEEQLAITASSGASITWTYVPTDALPLGTGPLRVGITAGTYTQRGFSGPPASLVFGVPVRARVRVMRHEDNCCGPPTITHPLTAVRRGLCP